MTPDYGEPWGAAYHHDEGRDRRFTVTREGRALFQIVDGPRAVFGPWRSWDEDEAIRLRVVACVNLLAGVPDEVLADPAAAGLVRAALTARVPVSAEESTPRPCRQCGIDRPSGSARCEVCGSGEVT